MPNLGVKEGNERVEGKEFEEEEEEGNNGCSMRNCLLDSGMKREKWVVFEAFLWDFNGFLHCF